MTSKQSAVPFKEIKRYGGFHAAGVVMQEIQHYSMVQVTAFPGSERQCSPRWQRSWGVVDAFGKGCQMTAYSGCLDDLNSYLIVAVVCAARSCGSLATLVVGMLW